MTAFNISTVALFPGIALVSLALVLLARCYSLPALAVGLAGLLTLTTASTWIASAGPVVDTRQIDDLKNQIAQLQKKLNEADQRKSSIVEPETDRGVPPVQPVAEAPKGIIDGDRKSVV